MEMNKHQRTQALLIFSVLSVVLSYPLLCKLHILEYCLQQFSFSIGKNYVFLLCNGLLAVIATSSGLIGCSPVETTASKAEKIIKSKSCSQRERLESSEKKGSVSKEKKVAKEVDQEAQGSKMESLALPLVQKTEDVSLVVLNEGEEEEEEEKKNEVVGVEEVEDEGFGSMSNEELKRIFDEFIRKMKENINFEARQLIMVQ